MEEEFKQMQQLVNSLVKQVGELSEWKARREIQQLADPLDDVSKGLLGAWTGDSEGNIGSLTENVSIPIGGVPTTINFTRPKTPTGVRLVEIGGAVLYIPYFKP